MAADASTGVYVMSVAAELAGVHPQTLRLYERRGLLEPARTGGGSRRYSADDLDRLARIATLTGAGVNIEGVKRILELEAQLADVIAELARHQRGQPASGAEGDEDPQAP